MYLQITFSELQSSVLQHITDVNVLVPPKLAEYELKPANGHRADGAHAL